MADEYLLRFRFGKAGNGKFVNGYFRAALWKKKLTFEPLADKTGSVALGDTFGTPRIHAAACPQMNK